MIGQLSVKTTRLAALAGIAATAVAASFLAPTATPADAAPSAGNPRAEAQQAAAAWVKGHGNALERASSDAFVRTGTFEGDNSIYSMAYERTHEGLRVVGGDFVVLANDAGQVVGSSVAQEAPVEIASTTAKIDAARATASARTLADQGAETTTPELVIWHRDAGTKLAYEVEVRGTHDGEVSWQRAWIDANTGDVLESREQIAHGTGTGAWEGSVTIPTSGSGTSYSMTNVNATTLKCQDSATNATFTGTDNAWGNGVATNKETGCVDAFYSAEQERLMLANWLGRNGMNGSGGWVPIRVGLNDVNAYYDGTQVQIGHTQTGGKWIGEMDVIAHEMGHGIDDRTPGGISGGNTQEFVADTFGAMTEWYANNPVDTPDYKVGEMVNLVGSGPIRYMYNPSLAGDDNCYSSATPTAEVHAAAGPGNHWFYLLAEGTSPTNGQPTSPTCNGTSITGIGIQKAAKIMYNAMLMKTSSSSYLKYRTWTLTAAKNLYGATSCTEFNAVKAAWDAVSVPAQAGDPTCSTGGGGTGCTGQKLGNPGFETGTAAPWTASSGVVDNSTGEAAHSGSWKAWMDGYGSTHTDTLSQSVSIPAGCRATLSFWLHIDTAETTTSTAYDKLMVKAGSTTLATYSNLNKNTGYAQKSFDVSSLAGQTVTISFSGAEDSSLQTSFVVDDTALNLS